MRNFSIILFYHFIILVLLFHTNDATPINNEKSSFDVAIIGGGIGGTFTSYYLSQFDSDSCLLNSVVLFDPSSHLDDNDDDDDDDEGQEHQGSRVSSLRLNQGLKQEEQDVVVELGASIIYSGNKLVTEMIDSDPRLTKVDPDTFSPPTNNDQPSSSSEDMDGLGIYDGNGQWNVLIPTTTNDESWWQSRWSMLKLLGRYHLWDVIRMKNAAHRAIRSFLHIYDILDDDENDDCIRSPDDLWKAVDLYEPTTMSFDSYLDTIGISKEEEVGASWSSFGIASLFSINFDFWSTLSFVRSLLPQRGLFRKEILTAINLDNYNQLNSRLNGLAGLVSFLPTEGDVYKVQGGNDQILTSAFHRAQSNHQLHCGGNKTHDQHRIRHVKASITSIISSTSSHKMQVFSNDTLLGMFDVVILAAPLQQSGITLLTNVVNTTTTNEKMKLNALDGSIVDHPSSSATRRYTQTVTTMIRNATLRLEHFGLLSSSSSSSYKHQIPGSIGVTEHGRNVEGFSALARLIKDENGGTSSTSTYKMFSREPFTEEQFDDIFNPGYHVEKVKIWGGGKNGGAYPDFDGGGDAVRPMPFLLHGDEQQEQQGGGLLYYVNAVESAVSAMEISAIGAKAVSKLVSKRLGLR